MLNIGGGDMGDAAGSVVIITNKCDNTGKFPREAALYLDFYGGLLTARQAEILDVYYNEDYSLSEISKGLGISRQAAHDALRSGTFALQNYEDKLGLVHSHLKKLEGEGDGELRQALAALREAARSIRASDADGRFSRETDDLESAAGRIEQIMTRG